MANTVHEFAIRRTQICIQERGQQFQQFCNWRNKLSLIKRLLRTFLYLPTRKCRVDIVHKHENPYRTLIRLFNRIFWFNIKKKKILFSILKYRIFNSNIKANNRVFSLNINMLSCQNQNLTARSLRIQLKYESRNGNFFVYQ